MTSKCADACACPLALALYCLLPIGLLICGTFVPYYFFTVSVPKYENYIKEEKHHIIKTCTNITATLRGK